MTQPLPGRWFAALCSVICTLGYIASRSIWLRPDLKTNIYAAPGLFGIGVVSAIAVILVGFHTKGFPQNHPGFATIWALVGGVAGAMGASFVMKYPEGLSGLGFGAGMTALAALVGGWQFGLSAAAVSGVMTLLAALTLLSNFDQLSPVQLYLGTFVTNFIAFGVLKRLADEPTRNLKDDIQEVQNPVRSVDIGPEQTTLQIQTEAQDVLVEQPDLIQAVQSDSDSDELAVQNGYDSIEPLIRPKDETEHPMVSTVSVRQAEGTSERLEAIVREANLTQREVQILVLVALQKSNKTIGKMLGIKNLNNRLSRGPYKKLEPFFPSKKRIDRTSLVVFLVQNDFQTLADSQLETLPGRQTKNW